MRLTVVGCTGSMSGPDSAASAYLVQAPDVDGMTGPAGRIWSLVLDMGPGSFGSLWRVLDPAPIESVDAVFLSHGHADHISDIMSLHVYTKWHPHGQRRPVKVFGPPGTLTRITQIEGAAPETTYEGIFDYQDLAAAQSVQVGPFTVTPFPGWHSVPSFGLRIEGPGGDLDAPTGKSATLCYTGDTDKCPEIVEMARDCDLLLSECGFTERDTTRGIHLTGVRAGEIVRESGARRLVLTHIQPWTDREVVRQEVRSVLDADPEFALDSPTFVV